MSETSTPTNVADVEEAIRGENIHFPPTRLICLENTQNRCGGAVVSIEKMAAVRRVAQAHGAQRLHVPEEVEARARELTAQLCARGAGVAATTRSAPRSARTPFY